MVDPRHLLSPSHPVVRELLARREDLAAGRDPAARGTRVALVVQGGAMRGVHSGGACGGLERLGLTSAFDDVHGESAGAINAAYFLAGQAILGGEIYSRDACTRRFINPWRLSCILDVDYLVDEIMTHQTPLDVRAVAASRSRFVVSLTRAEDGRPSPCEVGSSPHSLLEILRASAAATPLHRGPVLLGGVPYVDGGIGDPIPIRATIEAGATHVLALLTAPPERLARPLDPVRRSLLRPFLRSWSPGLRAALLDRRWRSYNAALDLAYGRTPAPQGVSIAVVPPPPGTDVGRLTIDPGRLGRALERGAEQLERLFTEQASGGTLTPELDGEAAFG